MPERALPKGLTEDVVRAISREKHEPEWMLRIRLQALEKLKTKKYPTWGPRLDELNLDEIHYYVTPDVREARRWEDVPREIREVYEKLGIPQAEREALAGVGAQFDASPVYHRLKEQWERLGVLFMDMHEAVRKHPDLVRKYFGRILPMTEHYFLLIHYAVWSGGTFLYVPKGVKVPLPLQAYFRMNYAAAGQFEHTLIIVEEDAEVHYIEGCSAPRYSMQSLHAGAVEIYVHERAHAKYSSVENWSENTFNLNTKRAIVEADASIEWIGGNLGAGVSMLYPSSILKGERAKSRHVSIGVASKPRQIVDVGAKVIIVADHCSATITSKSISMKGGISTYRGLVRVARNAKHATVNVECDALMMDRESWSNTYPVMDVQNPTALISHEARVGRISEEDIFYAQSRGLDKDEAVSLIVSGFAQPIIRELPLEYAVELNRLIQLEMEGSLG